MVRGRRNGTTRVSRQRRKQQHMRKLSCLQMLCAQVHSSRGGAARSSSQRAVYGLPLTLTTDQMTNRHALWI
jgi:hypothetical protein